MKVSDDRGLIERILKKTRLFTDGSPKPESADTVDLELEFAPEDMPHEVLPPVTVTINSPGVTTEAQSMREAKWEEIMRQKGERIRAAHAARERRQMEVGASMLTGGIKQMTSGFTIKSDSSGGIAGLGIGGIHSGLHAGGLLGEPSPFMVGGGAVLIADKMIHPGSFKEAAKAAIAKEKAEADAKLAGHHIPVEELFGHVVDKEMKRFGKDTDGADNVREVFGRVLKEMRKIAELNGTNLNEILENYEMSEEEKSAHQLALEALAAKMTENWRADEFTLEPSTFTVNSSLSLTVWKADVGGYRKHPHIGGEEFTPTKAHVGAKGHMIITFTPNQPEPYNWMEMPLTDCLVHLSGFQTHFVANFGPDWAGINNAKAEAKQAADIEKFGTSYADFGSY